MIPQLFSEDTLNAYGRIASSHRDRINPLVIGITGSSGKTTTKEILSSIVSSKYSCLKNEKNFVKLDSLNNQIIQEEIAGDIPYYDRIRDFLVTDTVKNLFLVRHGETFFNLQDRIGGNSGLMLWAATRCFSAVWKSSER